ncbi:MAG: FAD-dependent oxidoreductase [Candidatus Nitrosopolaris sp.]
MKYIHMSSSSSPLEKNDIIIIGGASAGLSAALYTSRQGLKTLLIAKDIGGQALLTNSIENYPAFEHIGGYELMSKLERQARVFGTESMYEEVTSIVENSKNHHTKGFTVKTSNNKQYSTLAIILAFGKTPRDLNVPGEQGLKGKGVSYCAVCDGPLFKQKRPAVIGIGDPALDSALFLKGMASKVYLIQESHMSVGSDDTIRLLQNEKNVSFIFNSVVKRVNGTSKVDSITIANTKNMSEESQLVIDGVFVEMGYTAKTDFVKNLVQLNSNNEIIVDKYCATSKQGIFAAGDVTDVPYKQAVISAGQGSIIGL